MHLSEFVELDSCLVAYKRYPEQCLYIMIILDLRYRMSRFKPLSNGRHRPKLRTVRA